MFDLKALEDAGFAKALTAEEWQLLQDQNATRYTRAGETAQGQVPGGKVVVDYVLERGDVRVSTEQNTQDQAPFGIAMTVRYPQIALVENISDGRRVTCDASNTALILAMADEVSKPLGNRHGPRDSSNAARLR
jgi:hypothetical protein